MLLFTHTKFQRFNSCCQWNTDLVNSFQLQPSVPFGQFQNWWWGELWGSAISWFSQREGDGGAVNTQNGLKARLGPQQCPPRYENLLCRPGTIPDKSQLIKFSKSESSYGVQWRTLKLFVLIFQPFQMSWVFTIAFQKLVTIWLLAFFRPTTLGMLSKKYHLQNTLSGWSSGWLYFKRSHGNLESLVIGRRNWIEALFYTHWSL